MKCKKSIVSGSLLDFSLFELDVVDGTPLTILEFMSRDILGSFKRSDGQHFKNFERKIFFNLLLNNLVKKNLFTSNIFPAISGAHKAFHEQRFVFRVMNCSLLIAKLSLAPSIIPIFEICLNDFLIYEI
jgi:hypothetical protein